MKRLISVLLSAATVTAVISCAAIPAGAVTRMLKGDLNNDGKVTLRDATLAQKIDAGVIGGSAEDTNVGDMNADGSITVLDAYLIQRLASRDSALLDGSSSEGIEAFCPNYSYREAFYEALNSYRESLGLSTIEVTDGMLAAGQELAEAWYTEASSGSSEFSGNRQMTDAWGYTLGYTTVFADYGLPVYSGKAPITTDKVKSVKGAAYFNNIVKDVDKNGESSDYYEMYQLFIKPELKAVCVGMHKGVRQDFWAITGF